MEIKIEFNIKQVIKWLLAGIFLSAVVTFNYIPATDRTSDIAFINSLLQCIYSLNGYSLAALVLALFFAAAGYFTRRYQKEHNISISWPLAVISIIFGILNTCGMNMYYNDELAFFRVGWRTGCSIILSIGYAVIFYGIAFWGLEFFSRNLAVPFQTGSKKRFADRHPFLFSVLLISVFWIPWIVIYYPASMDFDVTNQLDNVLGIVTPSNHHPWLSNTILAWFWELGHAHGNDNMGIFLMILVRDAIIVCIYSLNAVMVRKADLPRWVYYATVIFFAVTPYWGAYSKHAFKDTFGAAVFCAYILTLVVLIKKTGEDRNVSSAYFILNGAVGAFASLMRNNFIYCILPVTVLLLIWFFKKHVRIYKSLLLVLMLSVYFLYNHYIITYGGVEQGEPIAAYSIPLQQLARTVCDHRDELTDEELDEISTVINLDEVDNYDPLVSDPIKNSSPLYQVKDGKEFMKAILPVWLKYMKRYPISYAEAFLGQSYGYYAFTPKHKYTSGNWNSNMCVWDWIISPKPDEPYQFSYNEHTLMLRELLDKWAELWGRLPVVSMTNCIALFSWTVVLSIFWLLRKHSKIWTLPGLAVLLLIFTCIASPVNDCFRYFMPAAASLPALIAVLGYRNREERKPAETEEKQSENL